MILLRESFEISRPRQDVFDYIATVDHFSAWDPIIISVGRVGAGPVGEGETFHIDVKLLGPAMRYDYRVTHCTRPDYFEIAGRGRTSDIVDKITIISDDEKTYVTWIAEITFRGPTQFLEPLFKPVLQAAGAKAIANLKKHIERRYPLS